MTAVAEPTEVPGFERVTHLSKGGMGEVLLARRLGAHGFEKLVAIKTIRPELARRDDVRRMFLDEARLVARLDHPTIAQVYDFGDAGDFLYLAMEYVAGVSFSNLVDRAGPVPPGVAARLGAEVCRGLHAAHELRDLAGRPLSVVHRDVSPQNLLLTFDGRVKILDFGIALMRDRQAPVTLAGTMKGKPSYMAPEQVRGEGIDRRADVYALGVVLHELVTARPLFPDETQLARLRAVNPTPVPPLSSAARGVPAALEAAVGRALETDPVRRFADARALGDALEAVAVALGAESLDAFAERVLAAEREAHRARLAVLLGGEAELPGATPRRTRVDPLPPARAASLLGPTEFGPERTPRDLKPTTPARAAGPHPRSRRARSYRVAAVAAAGVALASGLAAILLRPSAPAPPEPPAPPRPAAAASSVAAAPTGSTAAAPASRPVAAPRSPSSTPFGELRPETATARPRPARRAPAPARSVDPRPVPPGPSPAEDAWLPPPRGTAETGWGSVTVGAEPYARVQIDGREVGVTPLIRHRLSAGSHEVVLLEPNTGAVRHRETLLLAADEHRRVTAP